MISIRRQRQFRLRQIMLRAESTFDDDAIAAIAANPAAFALWRYGVESCLWGAYSAAEATH